MTTLDEYLSATKSEVRTDWVQRTLPQDLVEQLVIHRSKGTSVRVMSEWLQSLGYDSTNNKLDYFFSHVAPRLPR